MRTIGASRRISAYLVCMLIGSATVPSFAVDSSKDWAVVVYRATQSASSVTGSVSLSAAGRPGAVLVLGLGMGAASQPGMIDVASLGGGPQQISTTSQLGGMSMSVGASQSVDSAFSVGSTYLTRPVQAGDTVAFLVFAAGGNLTGYSTSIEPKASFVKESVDEGTGSSVLWAASADTSGAAVGASYAAAGLSEQGATSGTGLVGGFTWWQFCKACVGSWSVNGSGEQVWVAAVTGPENTFGTGALSFAGPSGTWSWSWNGVGAETCFQGAPVYGAYAPVGDWWTYFRPGGGNHSTVALCLRGS